MIPEPVDPQPGIEKWCSGCGTVKSASAFGPHKKARSGLSYRCRQCENRVRRERDAANPEKAKTRSKKWRTENPKRKRAASKKWRENNKEAACATRKKWCEKNKERGRATSKKWYENNKEQYHATSKKWRENNKERLCALSSRRRARKKEAHGSHTAADRDLIFTIFGKKCLCCGGVTKLAIDHVIPLARGGPNGPTNLQPLCRSCNSRKGAGRSTDYRGKAGMKRLLMAMQLGLGDDTGGTLLELVPPEPSEISGQE